ncbi:MAG TPA: hypothetical protein VHQ86_04285 [Candidatus Saccharimonadia bacterium]|jgi:Tfp pilus assembly protein PilE|nr:hypothetical protein [Candidatus Saccharimonadia bacterium]
MVNSSRGFTVIQFIVAMTVSGLLLVGVLLMILQRTWRDDQRRRDLGTVEAMIERSAANNLGRYPKTKDADDPNSALRTQFQALWLEDPKAGKYYIIGSNFGPCDPSAEMANQGAGYISYGRPGDNGSPFKLRICLESGEYWFGN